MTLSRAFLSIFLVLPLAACPGPEKEDETGTGATDVAFPLASEADMEMGWAVASSPLTAPAFVFMASFMAGDGCPVVVEDTDTRYEVQGGCTNGEVTFEGNLVTTTDQSGVLVITFTDFAITDVEGSMRIEGNATMSDDILVTDDLSITATGDAAWRGGLDGVRIDHSGVEMDVGLTQSHSGPMRGQAVAAGIGALSWEGSVEYGGDCSGAMVGGSVVLSGSQDVTYTPSTDCTTDCVHWAAADGTTGEACF